MSQTRSSASWDRALIFIGSILFLAALAVSAYFEPQLRALHALQALIYIVVPIFARRNSPWAFGAGAMIALAWNSLNLFVTHLMQAGTAMLLVFLRTGHVSQPVTMMVGIGGFAHLLLLIGCGASFLRLSPGIRGWLQFVAGGLASIGWLVLAASLTMRHGV